jgi:hypothetical protein
VGEGDRRRGQAIALDEPSPTAAPPRAGIAMNYELD